MTARQAHNLARVLAKAAHAGQTDKANEPYFGHLERVAQRVSLYEDRTVAYLHDILEDTDLTDVDLIDAGFRRETVDAVLTLTRRKGERYLDYIDRVAKWGTPGAVLVKLADLADHLRDDSPYTLSKSMETRYREAFERLRLVSVDGS